MTRNEHRVPNPHLRTWIGLNHHLRDLKDEAKLEVLLKEELEGLKRKAFVRRIHCRLNKVRAWGERHELNGVVE